MKLADLKRKGVEMYKKTSVPMRSGVGGATAGGWYYLVWGGFGSGAFGGIGLGLVTLTVTGGLAGIGVGYLGLKGYQLAKKKLKNQP